MSEAKQSSNAMHWLMAGTLLLIAVFVVASVVIVNTEAGDPVDTQVTVGDSDPTVESVFTSDTAYELSNDWTGSITAFNSPVGTQTAFHVNGEVKDTNSYTDITGVSAVFYLDDGVNDETCTADSNDCYKVASCNTQNGSGNTLEYDCPMSLDFWASSTEAGGEYAGDDWRVYVSVTDGDGTDGTDDAELRDIPTVLGTSNANSMDFGARTPGETTTAANNEEISVENVGNDETDLKISGTALDCAANGGTGSIPVGNLDYALADGDHGTGTVMTGTATYIDTALDYRSDDGTALTDVIYYGLEVSEDVEGLCTGVVTMAACASGDVGCP